MTTPLLSFVILLILAYLGSTVYQRYRASSIWVKSITYTGSLFILLGFLIGPKAMGLLTEKVIEQLNVLVGFVLGWTGFLIGLQGKRTNLRRFPKSYFLFSSLNFFAMFTGLFISAFVIMKLMKVNIDLIYIFIFGIIGTVSSPILIAVLKHDFKIRGQLIHLLQFSIAFDNMIGVLLLGIAMVIYNNSIKYNLTSGILMLISIVLVLIISWLFYILTKEIKNLQQYFLLLIGSIILVVGIALNLRISILCSTFLFGLFLANLPISTEKLYRTIANAEKPLYFLLLIFIGASITEYSHHIIITLLVFLILRFLLKYLAGIISRFPIFAKERPINTVGLTHIGMGGVVLAMALDFHLINMNDITHTILFLITLAVIINDFYSFKIIKNVMNK